MIGTPVSWTSIGFGQLLKPRYGKALVAARRDPTARYPVVGSAGVMTATGEPLVLDPAVVIGRKGNVGQVQFFPDGCWPIDTTYFVTVPEELEAAYLTHYLRYLDLGRLDSSTATPSLRREDLEAQTVRFPELEEQRRIVEILEAHLETLARAEAQLSAALRRVDVLERSVHQIALRGALVVEDLREGTGRDLTQGIAALDPDTSEGRMWPVPAAWSWARIGDLFTVSVGTTPARGDDSLWNGGVPWVSSGEVAFNRIKTTKETIAPAALGSGKRIHPPGTVMLAMIGEGKTRGQAALLDIEAAHNQNCASIRVSATRILPEFVYAFFKERYLETRRGSSGGNQPALNKGRIQGIPIPVPPLGTQRRIVEELDRLATAGSYLRQSCRTSLDRVEALRTALLTAAFEGKLTGRHTGNDVIEELADV